MTCVLLAACGPVAIGAAVGSAGGSSGTPDTVRPVLPATITVTPQSDKSLRVDWSAAADDRGVKRYEVYYDLAPRDPANGLPYAGTQATQGASPVRVDSPTATSALLSGFVACTTTVYVRVRAVDGAGNVSDFSAEASARVPCGGNATFGSGASVISGSGLVVAAGDLDLDGDVDALLAVSPNQVVSLLGQGNGTFVTAGSTTFGGGLFDVHAADFNHDRVADLVVAHGGSVSVALGNGNGTFAAPVTFAVNTAIAIASGDFNGDCDLDLAIGVRGAVSGSHSVNIYLGNGLGGFAPGVTKTVGDEPADLVVADFDRDRRLDIAVACAGQAAGGSVFVLRGQTAGAFADAVAFGPPQASALVTGDFDADRVADLACLVAGGNVTILLGTGSAALLSGGVTFATAAASADLAVGDVNADGIADLVACHGGATQVAVAVGNGVNGRGDGTFGAAALTSVANGATTAGLALADFNDDGILDLGIAGSLVGSAFTVLLGNGAILASSGAFDTASRIVTDTSTDPFAIVSDDFDGDNIPDLAVSCRANNVIDVLLGTGSTGQGTGAFSAVPGVAALVVGNATEGLALGDFNGDGIPDLVAASKSEVQVFGQPAVGVLRTFHGSRTSGQRFVFQAVDRINTALQGPRSIATGDFNCDGLDDIAVACLGASQTSNDGGVIILLAGAGGTFAASPQVLRLNSNLIDGYGIATGDLDNDGWLDLVVTDSDPNLDQFHVLMGDPANPGQFIPQAGNPYFTSPNAPMPPAARFTVPFGVRLGDFNGDRRLDLLVLNQGYDPGTPPGLLNNAQVTFVPGDGTGSFAGGNQRSNIAEIGQWPGKILVGFTVADLDGDHLVDIAVGNITDGRVEVFFGTGTVSAVPNFTPQPNVATYLLRPDNPAPWPYWMTADDFDANGTVDLVVTDGRTRGVEFWPGIPR